MCGRTRPPPQQTAAISTNVTLASAVEARARQHQRTVLELSERLFGSPDHNRYIFYLITTFLRAATTYLKINRYWHRVVTTGDQMCLPHARWGAMIKSTNC